MKIFTGDDVTVVIPTYYRHDIIGGVLTDLASQSIAPYEVIVVDQTPSGDFPTDFYDQFSTLPLNVVKLDIPSLSQSKNHGASICKTDLILFLDDDTILGSNLIESHLEVINDERVDVVSGAVSDCDQLRDDFSHDMQSFDPLSFFLKCPNKKWNGMVLVQSGPNACLKKEIFLAVGGYDENMPRMEDVELGLRMFQYGAKMYYSTKPFVQFLRHPTGGTRETQINLEYVKLFSKVYLYKKHFPGWTTKQYFLKEFINCLLFKESVSGHFSINGLLKPWVPLVRLVNLFKVNMSANRCLGKVNQKEFKKNIN